MGAPATRAYRGGVEERRRPGRLRDGATVVVAAPSGPVVDPARVARGVAALEGAGLRVELAPHARDADGYLAGTDADRAADLLDALERPDAGLVLCLRGGYGALRALLAADPDRLDALARRQPVPFVGFSDATVLHAALGRRGWVTFSGPTLTTLTSASLAALLAALRGGPLTYAAPRTLLPGRAGGRLAGGCLSLLVSLLGGPEQPDLDGALLLLEDVNEAPYQVDRMLTTLMAAGVLAGVRGVVGGEWIGCHPRGGAGGPTVEDVLVERLAPLGIPVVSGLALGHGADVLTVPLGVPGELDATAGILTAAAGVRAD